MPFIGPYWKNFATLFGGFVFYFKSLRFFGQALNMKLPGVCQRMTEINVRISLRGYLMTRIIELILNIT